MKKVTLISLILLLVAGAAYATNYAVTKKVGGYTVVATIDKNPPVVGDNNITIGIKDAAGNAVTDAKVKVEYSMPAMSGMPAMNYKSTAPLAGSEYKTKINLSMSGSWNIAVKVMKGGKSPTMKFTVDAH